MTMKAAQDLARKRWKGKTEEERTEHGKMMSDERMKLTTPEQRSAIAKKAAAARWGPKTKATKKKGAKKK